MGLMLLPQNAPDATKNVAYMVDEIWYHAGDTSTDVSIQHGEFICIYNYYYNILYFIVLRVYTLMYINFFL